MILHVAMPFYKCEMQETNSSSFQICVFWDLIFLNTMSSKKNVKAGLAYDVDSLQFPIIILAPEIKKLRSFS